MEQLRRGVHETGELSRRSGGAPALSLMREWRDRDRSAGEEAPPSALPLALPQFSPANFSARYRWQIRLDTARHRSSILSTLRRWDRISHLQSNNDGLKRMAPASIVIKEVTGKQSALNVKEERNVGYENLFAHFSGWP